VRRRTGQGRPVPIVVPDSYPGASMGAAAGALRPLAHAARAASEADRALREGYSGLFPSD